MQGPEKNSYKEFDNKKNSCGSKIPLPPHNFSNGPSLSLELGMAFEGMTGLYERIYRFNSK